MFDVRTKQLLHHFTDAHTGIMTVLLVCLTLYVADVLSLALSGDDKLIFSGSADKSIKIFDVETKQQLHQFENLHLSIFISLF